jgi:flagellar L-ring protein precursor FlgH
MTGYALLTLATFAACATVGEKVVPNQAAAARSDAHPPPQFYQPVQPSEGSLWTETGALLFVDQRARYMGDTVTIDIVENTSSSMDANTKLSRSSSIDAGVQHFLGRPVTSNGTNLGEKLFEANLDNKFNGKASSDRSGQVTASIGARVTEVLPNGNLLLYGRREMKVNNETQYIVVSGIARPQDVGPDNRIKSVYLSDARIEYFGRGVLADKQKPGWLSRALDHAWPF